MSFRLLGCASELCVPPADLAAYEVLGSWLSSREKNISRLFVCSTVCMNKGLRQAWQGVLLWWKRPVAGQSFAGMAHLN